MLRQAGFVARRMTACASSGRYQCLRHGSMGAPRSGSILRFSTLQASSKQHDKPMWSETGFKDLENEVASFMETAANHLEKNQLLETAKKLQAELDKPNLWDNPQEAAKVAKQHARALEPIEKLESIKIKREEISSLVDMALDEGADANINLLYECSRDMKKLVSVANRFRLELLLSEPSDHLGCIVEISAGAGGAESMDFAEMLLNMYRQWAEASGYTVRVGDTSPGTEAGIRGGVLYVEGESAYGWMKTESGVHRLVRISEYDSNRRRQTCFVQVGVLPAVGEGDADVELNMSDLRFDTYRSSGPGGQHVNTTDSAVRITHLPTGIVAQSQDQRSQHTNRERALQVLKARLLHRKLEEERQKKSEFKATLGENTWGNQIRSYVLHPYKMVKDHRTEHETSQAEQVLGGSVEFLTPFMEAMLLKRSS